MGPQGAQGPTGVDGAAGPAGPAGPTGPSAPIIIGGGSSDSNLQGNTVNYVSLFGSLPRSAAESEVAQVLPVGGTLSSMQILLNGSPGGGKHYVFTVRRNGSDTELTCTVAGTGTTCADVGHSVVFAAGDTIALKATPIGGPTARRVGWTGRFSPAP